MEGPALAISLVNNHLKWDLPTRLPIIEAQHNLVAGYLKPPAEYYDYEPSALDHWPTIVTSVMRTNRVVGTGEFSPDSAQHLYDIVYTMRTYGWVRADKVDKATKGRYFTSLAVREAFIDRSYLAPTPAEQVVPTSLDIFSIQEEFGDPVHDDTIGENYIAAFYLQYNVTITETMYRRPWGILTEPHVDVIQLPYTT